MDWTDLQVFVEVARTGSVLEAERRLGLSAPTLRRRIEAFEEACGFVLFDRSTRGLTPTPLGLRFLKIVEPMDAGPARADAARHRRSQWVTLATTEVFAAHLVASSLAELKRVDPGISIDLRPMRDPFGLVEAKADIFLMPGSGGGGDGEARCLGRMECGFYAHRDYLEATGHPRSPKDLKRFSLIGREADFSNEALMAAVGLPLQPADFGFRTDSMVSQIAAMRAGVGIGATWTAVATQDPDLVRVGPEASFSLDLWIWSPREAIIRGPVRRAYDALARDMARLATSAAPLVSEAVPA